MLARAELAAWLRLTDVPGVGRARARELLARHGSPEAVVACGELPAPSADFESRLAATEAWLDGDAARGVVSLADPEYPAALLQTADPPLLLYVHGRVALLGAPSVAIVGSRNPTPAGVDNAREFAAFLSRRGLAVVSGLALGIDGAAHEGALQGEGSTVAVVGTGLDRIYPPLHAGLARRIAAEGLLVSEFGIGVPPLPDHFPQRNRIIAGLARGTLVVEATLRSGSLITARMAAEAGREVFAIPGSIHAPQARGCHKLIKQGAKLVDAAEDILEELRPPEGAGRADAGETAVRPAGPADPVLDALGHDPATLDTLVERTGWPAQRLNAHLLELELEARVVRLPGGLFQRRAGA